MTSGKIRIALDLGYASIGWVVSRGMLEGLEILGCGTVIFEPDRCLASDRRAFRRQRRHIRATRTRIERMRAFLTARGVLTPALAGVRHPHPEPWRLAAEALTAGRILTAAEFWAVLLWYAHNRGYDGNRLWSRRGGETEAADAFETAIQLFDPLSTNARVIVMFTDGKTTAGAPPAPVAAAARAAGICSGSKTLRG